MIKSPSQLILGIDPGLATTGYGLVLKERNKLAHIAFGCILTPAKQNFIERLETIHNELEKIIKKYQPQAVAVEALFFCKNVKTALDVSQARGVILLTAIENKLPLYEFTPLEIKQAVTGYGRAEKKQIQKMVKIILDLKEIPEPDDAADALAIAICGANSQKLYRKI
jgi:crossover junction endodeoxyribonuclease RuvC